MDISAFIGLGLGIGAILLGQLLEGGHLSTMVNFPAFIIVLGGTLGAVLLQSPRAIFRRALQLLPLAFLTPKRTPRALARTLIKCGSIVRKEGILALENLAEKESDPFLREGLRFLVDGMEPVMVRSVLEFDSDARVERDLRAARVFESMGGYCPTIGILGAVLGLIHVMNNLADPTTLGMGIATSFVATIYGVGGANLLFIPLANKLKTLVNAQGEIDQMIIMGLMGIAEGNSPRVLELKLTGYIEQFEQS